MLYHTLDDSCAAGAACTWCPKSVFFAGQPDRVVFHALDDCCLVRRTTARVAILRRQLKNDIVPDPLKYYNEIFEDDYDRLVELTRFKLASGLLDTICDYDQNRTTAAIAATASMIVKSEVVIRTSHHLTNMEYPDKKQYRQWYTKNNKSAKLMGYHNVDVYVNSFSRAYRMIKPAEKKIGRLFLRAMKPQGSYSTLEFLRTSTNALTPTRGSVAYWGDGYLEFVEDLEELFRR